MLRTSMAVGAVALATTFAVSTAVGHDDDGPRPLRPDAQWTTVFKPPAGVGIEGLTADRRGNLYTPGRGVVPCPVFRISGGVNTVVGNLPAPCNPAGLAFGDDGRLYVADSGRIMVFKPSAEAPPTATEFATGVPGSNGVAFDRRGDLWVSDGTTAQGRVWRIGKDRVPVEAFRVQPLANDVSLPAGSAATSAGCRPERSRSPRRAAPRPTRSAPSTSWPTASRSAGTAPSTWPTPPAARSGR